MALARVLREAALHTDVYTHSTHLITFMCLVGSEPHNSKSFVFFILAPQYLAWCLIHNKPNKCSCVNDKQTFFVHFIKVSLISLVKKKIPGIVTGCGLSLPQ